MNGSTSFAHVPDWRTVQLVNGTEQIGDLVRLYSTNAMRTKVLFMSWTAVYPAVRIPAARGRISDVRNGILVDMLCSTVRGRICT